jgi:hypothetical protein
LLKDTAGYKEAKAEADKRLSGVIELLEETSRALAAEKCANDLLMCEPRSSVSPEAHAYLLAELEKHPYHSSKTWVIILVEKPGTGIFLMKESSKLYRPQKEREKKKLSKRLGGPSLSSADSRIV